ncbi:SPOR domain-containing protein [Streptomyces sp. NBC_00237]|uniref:SPOR domain-containing protein n=1 Tax=Streptomyces sp. NBC_00237 TaxID=2975687 RepID=UPI002252C13E|nr:SPOR domain-containing protein [Streptomyces sp. NBC_00237]MCX5204456.1 SPOR domain-containing protein [Streptomyces sp. NBC_00237]
MNDGGDRLAWLVVRQDDNGNRYRVGAYATRAEAERKADQLDAHGHKQLYLIEQAAAKQQ